MYIIEFNGNTISSDEGPREPNIDKIKSLDPAFDADGTITAATSSPISIGSSAILLTSNTLAENSGLKPEFKVLSRAVAGVDWTKMGMGPLPATEKALKKANLSMDDIDVIESNEAFAVQALCVANELNFPAHKVNPNGGAIALGHPVGATGAILTTKCLYELKRTQGKYGLVTMCIGGGQGIAAIFEAL